MKILVFDLNPWAFVAVILFVTVPPERGRYVDVMTFPFPSCVALVAVAALPVQDPEEPLTDPEIVLENVFVPAMVSLPVLWTNFSSACEA